MNSSTTTTAEETEAGRVLLVEEDWGPDPLEGVPVEHHECVGALDHDTAGGCG